MTDAFARGGIALRELRADGGAAAMDLLLRTPGDELATARVSQHVARGDGARRGDARGSRAPVAGRSLEQLGELWEFDARFEPDDPIFVDLGYAAWLPRASSARER